MLIEFKFTNYRSFRDETVLSMEAMGLGTYKSCLIPFRNKRLLPAAAIYGKNGGGKSNVIRAFWLAVQFIRNAQRTQHENAPIPVQPFLLNDTSRDEPTSFEFIYTIADVKYVYGFSATKRRYSRNTSTTRLKVSFRWCLNVTIRTSCSATIPRRKDVSL